MNRLWRHLGKFLRAKKCWRWPKQSDVLIFDATGQESFMKYLQPWNPEVLHVRFEQINMRVLFASLFRSKNRSEAYIDCFIKRESPRLIITFIDNSPNFYSLSYRHQNVKTLFIQNGVRGYYLDVFETFDSVGPYRDCLKVDHMMTFGSSIGAEYAKFINGNVIPMGSLKNNTVPKSPIKKTGTIVFVSQYRNINGFVIGNKFRSSQEFFEQPDKLVLMFLMKYAKKYGKKLSILLCSNLHIENGLENEMRYYNEMLGQPCDFFKGEGSVGGYVITDSAEVVVGIDSTLLYESAARGNKTAILSVRSYLMDVFGLTYGWPGTYPDEGPFWTNHPDPTIFERILDHLFAINDEQWQEELSEHGFSNIMAYDPGNSILQTVLRNELGEPNIS